MKTKNLEENIGLKMFIKGNSLVYPNELESFEDNNFSFYYDFTKGEKDLEKWFEEFCFKVKPNIQFDSLVLDVDKKTLEDPKFINRLYKLTNFLSDHLKNFKLLSICLDETDDTVFAYSDKIKKNMEEISTLYLGKQVRLIDAEYIDDYINAASLEGINSNYLEIEDSKVNFARKRVQEMAELIKSKTDSPYEQHLLALHYISQFVYTLDDSQPYLSSRSLSEILPNNAKYICCVGYARLYTEVMRELGFDVKTQPAKEHLRAKVLIQDEKYGINGIYAVDPTWLSRVNNGDSPTFNFNKFANLNFKTLIDSYNPDFSELFNSKSILERNAQENEYYLQLKDALSQREFSSYSELLDFLEAEYYETRANIFDDFINLMDEEFIHIANKELAGKENKSFKGSILIPYLEKVKPKGIDENLATFIKYSPGKRKKIISQFIKQIEKEFMPMDFERKSSAYRFILRKSVKFGIPSLFAKAYFSPLNDYESYDENYADPLKEIKEKKVFLKELKSISLKKANRGERYNEGDKNQIKTDKIKDIEEIIGEHSKSVLSENFTSLDNKQFKKLLNKTKEIPDETLLRGVEAIKKLTRPSDYKLFEQDRTGQGVHTDKSYEERTLQ